MIYSRVAQCLARNAPEARGSTGWGVRRKVPPSGEFRLVERLPYKRTVGGSIPSPATRVPSTR